MARKNGFTEADVPDQSGKCFLVTGANTGIGFETARVLAARGARVLLACRDQAKAEAAMARIRQATPDADIAFIPLDQADLESVRKAAELAAREPRIDVLVNNAGVMAPPLMRTAQGFELQFGVNHLGTFALTNLLLPKIAEAKGRIVVTASQAHRMGKFDWDDLNAERGYRPMARYSASKLANLLFVSELDRRIRAAGLPVTVVGCHPGVATTELVRHGRSSQKPNAFVSRLLNTAAMGAWPTLQAATDTVEPGGYYGPSGFLGVKGTSGPASRSKRARDPALARRLWDVSEDLTAVKSPLPAVG